MTSWIIDGELPIQQAPLVKLSSGACCIPQHYLQFRQTLHSVEQIVLQCNFEENVLIFCGEDDSGIYVQIGMVGYDTYKPLSLQATKKIVYGRKWRIDANIPTSEVIQTTFLAIKKAREHEVRELLKIGIRDRLSSPFSTHQDAPLISQNAGVLGVKDEDGMTAFSEFTSLLKSRVKQIQFDASKLELINIERRLNQQILLDLHIPGSEKSILADTQDSNLTLILEHASINHFLHSLMDALIAKSDRYVSENFSFQGVARFSQSLSIESIGELSLMTRLNEDQETPKFKQQLSQYNFDTDRDRAPCVSSKNLAKSIQNRLETFGDLSGHYPRFR